MTEVFHIVIKGSRLNELSLCYLSDLAILAANEHEV